MQTIGRVVHTYPVNAFNPEGVEHMFTTVTDAARELENWVYYSHPQPEAAMTPDGVKLLTEWCRRLPDYGCIGIALLSRNRLAEFLQRNVAPEVAIPIFASDDEKELDRFVESLINDSPAAREA